MARDRKPETAQADEVDADPGDELYALPSDRFTEARDARAAELKQAGRPDEAAAVKKLRKPTAVAWLANQLARRQPDEIAPLLELGTALREATATLDAGRLRALSRQQHQLVAAMTRQARALADELGQPVSEATARGLEETLHAALADEDAARDLAAGRLHTGLSASGFGFPGAAAATTRSATASATGSSSSGTAARRTPTRTAKGDRHAAAREQADRDEAEARSARDAAESARDRAQDRLTAAEAATRAAGDELERLRAALADATTAHNEAQSAERHARTELDEAQRAARRAEQRVQQATEHRRRLDG